MNENKIILKSVNLNWKWKKKILNKKVSKGYKTNTNTKCTLNFFPFLLIVIDPDIKLSPELSRKLQDLGH